MRNKPGLALRVVVSAYYVLSGDYFTPTRVLAASMRISLRDYWRELEKGEEAVSTGLKMIGLRESSGGRWRGRKRLIISIHCNV